MRRAAIAAPVTVGHESASYATIPTPNGYVVDGVNGNPFEIAGVGVFEDNGAGGGDFTGSLADYRNRVRITGDNLEPVDAGEENGRLDPGLYRITAGMTHSGFVGTLTLTLTLDVETTLDPNDVVAEADRRANQPVAIGHFGESGDAGHVVTILGNHDLSGFVHGPSAAVIKTGREIEIKASEAVTAALAAVVTADATCTDDADRNCADLKITLSVTFTPVASRAQNPLNSFVDSASYDHDLLAPSGYDFNAEGATLSVASVSNADGSAVAAAEGVDLLTIDADKAANRHQLDLAVAGNGLKAGMYLIVADMTHPDFLGALGLTVMADIRTPVTADDVANNLAFTQQAAPGYFGEAGRTIGIDNKYILEDLRYNEIDFTVAADTDQGKYAVRLARAMPSDRDLTAAVTANVTCAESGPNNCAPLQITLSVTFARATATTQALLIAGDKDEADYNHAISLAAAHEAAGPSLRIAGAQNTETNAAVTDIATRVKIESGQLKRFGDEAGQRLEVGDYEITLDATTSDTQAGFLGTLAVVITADILNSVDPNSVVAEAERTATVSVAVGHIGDSGYTIMASTGYTLTNVRADGAAFAIASAGGGSYEIRFLQPMPDSETEAVATMNVTCTDDAASPAPTECAPLVLTITATFKPVSFDGVEQSALNAADTAEYNHQIALPSGYAAAEAVFAVVGDLSSRVRVDSQGRLQPVDAGDVDQRLASGKHTITVQVSHAGFAGTLTVTVTAEIAGELLADSVAPERDLTLYAVKGHFGDAGDAGHLITVEHGHALSDVTASEGVVAEAGDNAAGDQVLTVRLAAGLSDVVNATVAAGATCTDRECASISITIVAQFVPLTAPLQNDATVSEKDAAYDHEIVIPAELAAAKAVYNILTASKADGSSAADYSAFLTVTDGRLQPAAGGLQADDANGTQYEVVISISHGDLLGETFGETTLAAHVGEPVDGTAVLAANDRAVSLNVVEGYFGDSDDAGHTIRFAEIADVSLTLSSPPASSAFEAVYKGTGQYEVRLAAAMSVDIESVTLTATAACIPGGVRICVDPAAVFPVTAVFNRIVPVPQTEEVNSDNYEADDFFDFSTDYAGGIYADATFSESPESPDFAVDASGNVGTERALAPGAYAVTVEAVNNDENSAFYFLGTATLTLSLTVRPDTGEESLVVSTGRMFPA